MKIKKIFFTIIVTLAILFICNIKSEAALKLNQLDFEAQINTDGSMYVTETWDINISDTNTLFKTFIIDNTKYSSINNVIVKDISLDEYFTKINNEMYHVTKNCFYALKNSKGAFEIAWGVGFDNSSARKTYEISYKVNGAISKFSDYAELYWQFIGDDFEINADKINGTIYLPYYAESKEDIKVWGHTEQLNGEIYVTDFDKIEFTIDNYSKGNYVEVRTLIPNYMIGSTDRTYNYDILDKVLTEETKWANEANAKRVASKIVIFIIIVILLIITLFFVVKIFKNIIKLKSLEAKLKPITKLKYFREPAYESATPAEALFIMSTATRKRFSDSFSANILDLCLKKYISLEVEKKDVIKINLLDIQNVELKEDEKLTLDFLKEVAKDKKQLTTKDITKYLEKHSSKITKLDKKIEGILEKESEQNEKYNKSKNEEYNNYTTLCLLYIIFGICSIIFIPLGIALIINGIIVGKIASKINILTQKGVNEKEQWKAFKQYMQDFSLLKEKEIPSLVVWEKYLVFATAFGISDKVLKQLKVTYPEIADINSAMYTYSYINIMNSVNIGNCINSSIYSATASSGSGSGGGFSGGGGGGRRPVVVAGGR